MQCSETLVFTLMVWYQVSLRSTVLFERMDTINDENDFIKSYDSQRNKKVDSWLLVDS